MSRPGATPEEWGTFRSLDIDCDLLPVVSDLSASISPNSSLRTVGKVPSCFNSSGQVVGISEWTRKESTPADIERWSIDPRLGICVKTNEIRALDIDVDDPVFAGQVEEFFTGRLGPLPCRTRGNSGKRLLVVRIEGNLPKRVISTEHGRIEFLGTGQQFVAAGTHPSGARYEWRDGLPDSIPWFSAEDFDVVWRSAEERMSLNPRRVRFGKAGEDDAAKAPVAASSQTAERLTEGYTFEVVRLLRSAIARIPVEEADDYDQWVYVGHCLKELWLRCAEPQRNWVLGLWHTFSAKSHLYEESESQEKWDEYLQPRNCTYAGIFKIARRYGWSGVGAVSALELTDAGNVDIFVELSDDRLRYVPELRQWLYWDGARWVRDADRLHVQRIALSVADVYEARLDIAFMKEVEQEESSKRAAAALSKWVRHSRSRRGIDDMLKLATARQELVIAADRLDTNKSLLGVRNGVVDLRTGVLQPSAKDDYVTIYINVNYDPTSCATRWNQFIAEVTGTWDVASYCVAPRPLFSSYVQKAFGYMLTGYTHEHKMFVAIGEGANGKSVMLDTIEQIFNGYVRVIPPESMMATSLQSDPERASPVLASLRGARLAISSESKVGQKLDVALIKRHTGGGSITARGMRSNAVTFEITHKLILMTNARPKLDHLDAAIQGRLHIIPFDVRWNRPGSAVRDPSLPDGDKTLTEKLKAEYEGILAWCVAGAVSYFQSGLEPPAEVMAMTNEFLNEEDVVGRWIDCCSRPKSANEGGKAAELFESFNLWCSEQGRGDLHMSQKAFSQELLRRGIAMKKVENGTRYGLIAPSEFDLRDLV